MGNSPDITRRGETPATRAAKARNLGAVLANHSLLAYYVLDEPKWPSVPEDLAMASAVAAGDPHQRPSLTLLCGIQCGEAKWNSTAYHQFASGNTIMAVDSYTEYKHHRFVSPDGSTSGSGGHIVEDIRRMKALLLPGQPLIVTLQAIFLLVYDCEHHKPHSPPNCAIYRYIEPDEARAEGAHPPADPRPSCQQELLVARCAHSVHCGGGGGGGHPVVHCRGALQRH